MLDRSPDGFLRKCHGPNARWMNPIWAESLMDQCRTAGVAFFMKQMTRKEDIPPHLMVRQMPRAA